MKALKAWIERLIALLEVQPRLVPIRAERRTRRQRR